MVQIGNVISLSVSPDESETFLVAERIDDIGHGEGGWKCVDIDALLQKGANNITPFDCWRITDKYLDAQMKRGVIQIVESIK